MNNQDIRDNFKNDNEEIRGIKSKEKVLLKLYSYLSNLTQLDKYISEENAMAKTYLKGIIELTILDISSFYEDVSEDEVKTLLKSEYENDNFEEDMAFDKFWKRNLDKLRR